MGTYWLDGRLGADWPPLDVVARGAGLDVSTWSGWQNRSRSSGGFTAVRGVVVHHTASPTTVTFQNDWSYCAVGHPDAPVANMLLGRQGQLGIHAAGASNHAGKGGPWSCSSGVVPADSANSNMIGIEASNNGVGETWAPAMLDAYERLVAALCDAYRLDPARDVVAHYEWGGPVVGQPGRKIDPFGPAGGPGFAYAGARSWAMRPGPGTFTDAVATAAAGGEPDQEAETMLQLITPTGVTPPAGVKTFARWSSGALTHATNADTLLASRLGIAADRVEMGADQYQNLCTQAGVEP